MDKAIEQIKVWVEALESAALDPASVESLPVLVASGVILLLFGRRIYWVLLVLAGMAAGAMLGVRIMPEEPGWLYFATPGVLGLFVALLSWFLNRLAIRAAGMLVGGFMGYALAGIWLSQWWPWAGMFLGCVLGLLLGIWIFDWALILLTSAAGAFLFVVLLPLPQLWLKITLGSLLLVCGLAVQAHMMKPAREREASPS